MPAKRTERTTAKSSARHPSDYTRQAYEHLGRIEILEGSLAGSPFVDVTVLVDLAQQQLRSGNARNATGLLQAAEHVCFAALAPVSAIQPLLSASVRGSITAEFKSILQRSEERWHDKDDPVDREAIATLYSNTLAEAQRAFAHGAFRPALELARAAESLSLIGEGLPASIPQDGLSGRLAS